MSTPNPLNDAKAAAGADAAKAKAELVAVDGKLTTWIKNNAGKISIAVLVAIAVAVWKIL